MAVLDNPDLEVLSKQLAQTNEHLRLVRWYLGLLILLTIAAAVLFASGVIHFKIEPL